MATKGFKQPIYILGLAPYQIGARTSDGFTPIYDCIDFAAAREISAAMNLVWQTIAYGAPDPALKTEFKRKYGDKNYCAEDVQEFAAAMDAIGILPLGWDAHAFVH